MLLHGAPRTYYELTPREKMDVVWANLLHNSAGALSNPVEVRAELKRLIYDESEVPAAPGEAQLEYVELPGKHGRIVRVPTVSRDTKLPPQREAKIEDVTDAKREQYKALLARGFDAMRD